MVVPKAFKALQVDWLLHPISLHSQHIHSSNVSMFSSQQSLSCPFPKLCFCTTLELLLYQNMQFIFASLYVGCTVTLAKMKSRKGKKEEGTAKLWPCLVDRCHIAVLRIQVMLF